MRLFSFSSLLCLVVLLSACGETKKITKSPDRKRETKIATVPTTPKKNATEEGTAEYKVLVKFTQSVALQEAFKQAKAENKPIFVDFYTSYCAPCKIMDEYVFTAPDLAQLLNSNFVNYHYNCEDFDAYPFMNKYNVTNYPTLLFLRPDGTVIKSIVGSLTYTQMKKEAQSALSTYKTGK